MVLVIGCFDVHVNVIGVHASATFRGSLLIMVDLCVSPREMAFLTKKKNALNTFFKYVGKKKKKTSAEG